MIVLSGAVLVLPDRVIDGGSLVIDNGAIAAIESRRIDGPAGARVIALSGHIVAPGFVDVHVHGVEGTDVLDGAGAVAEVAARLPKYGVTAFCPTSIACAPQQLATFLSAIERARMAPAPKSSRVLPAHLESNFINPDWKGAQPEGCLRTPQGALGAYGASGAKGEFNGSDILAVIESLSASVGIVTLAPELPGGLDLVRRLTNAGHRVSLGHSGATYEEARAAIEAGASHATHLFNRMSSITSRSPGVVGAVLESEAVAAEIICDGYHVHPSLVSMAIRLKSAARMMAITDGTAASGLPRGARAKLGDQTIIAGDRTALLEDGTLAGSVLTMDGAFRMLVRTIGLSLTDAARMCATTPSAAMGLSTTGSIATGKLADLVVMDGDFRVTQTFLSGTPAL
jgi:N-acetylglucosamine-6-phosphate deacetylase